MDISNDEMTVLALCYQGQSVMAIGRWEGPCEHLVELGLLEQHDKFNHSITSAGEKVYTDAQTQADDNLAKALIGQHNAGVAYRKKAEELAQQLATLVKDAAKATSHDLSTAANNALNAIQLRVNEILGL